MVAALTCALASCTWSILEKISASSARRRHFLTWKEPHGGTGNGLFIDLTKVPQGFASHNLVGVDKAKPSCGHILGFSDVEELFTLPNVDGNFTPLSAMLFILTALILEMIFDSEFLQGGMQDSGKTLNVQAVTTNLGSYHSLAVGVRKD